MVPALLLITLLGMAAAGIVEVRDCDADSKLREVQITGCDVMPCNFYVGHNVNNEIDVESKTNYITEINYNIFYYHSKVTLIPIVVGNGCRSLLIGECAFLTGNLIRFKVVIPALGWPFYGPQVVQVYVDDQDAKSNCLFRNRCSRPYSI